MKSVKEGWLYFWDIVDHNLLFMVGFILAMKVFDITCEVTLFALKALLRRFLTC